MAAGTAEAACLAIARVGDRGVHARAARVCLIERRSGRGSGCSADAIAPFSFRGVESPVGAIQPLVGDLRRPMVTACKSDAESEHSARVVGMRDGFGRDVPSHRFPRKQRSLLGTGGEHREFLPTDTEGAAPGSARVLPECAEAWAGTNR